MDWDLFKEVAEECGRHGALIRITGSGEPFMHPQAAYFASYAKQVGCKVGIITNGSKIDKATADILLYNSIDVIEISVDAKDKKTYEKIRKGLKWDTLVNNINYLISEKREKKLPTRVIVSVINQKLVEEEIKEIEKYWYDFGVDYVIIRKYLVYDTLKERDTNFKEEIIEESALEICPYPFERLEVNINGDIKFCLYDIKSKVVLGNVQSNTIEEIWKGRYLENVRECMAAGRIDQLPFCRDCKDRKYRSWDHNYTKVLKEVGVK